MNLIGTTTKKTVCFTISSDILMTPEAFLRFAQEAALYVWDDHEALGYSYSEAEGKLRIQSPTDVSCVLEDSDNENEDLEESTDLIAILQKYMEGDQVVRLVTTFDGPNCFGASAVKFNHSTILAKISTNDIED